MRDRCNENVLGTARGDIEPSAGSITTRGCFLLCSETQAALTRADELCRKFPLAGVLMRGCISAWWKATGAPATLVSRASPRRPPVDVWQTHDAASADADPS